jgi:hypothetical protein
LWLIFIAFENAEDVHPEEGGGRHEDNPQGGRHQEEVDVLNRHPKSAACPKSSPEFFVEFTVDVLPSFHQTHSDVEDVDHWRHGDKLIQNDLTAESSRRRSNDRTIQIVVPVVESNWIDR